METNTVISKANAENRLESASSVKSSEGPVAAAGHQSTVAGIPPQVQSPFVLQRNAIPTRALQMVRASCPMSLMHGREPLDDPAHQAGYQSQLSLG